MPYAPAIKIVGGCDLMFLSGATASPALPQSSTSGSRAHPSAFDRGPEQECDGGDQVDPAEPGCTWRDVIKVTKYLTDFREADAMHKTMAGYFGDWLPAHTTVCINQLSSPGARIELDMIVALPKAAGK